MAYISIISSIRKAVKSVLGANGAKVGTTAGYPRIEIHPGTENAPLDKGMKVRSIEYTIECLSAQKYADCVAMQTANIERLLAAQLNAGASVRVLGMMPGQVREMVDTADSANVIYRIMQDITIWVETI